MISGYCQNLQCVVRAVVCFSSSHSLFFSRLFHARLRSLCMRVAAKPTIGNHILNICVDVTVCMADDVLYLIVPINPTLPRRRVANAKSRITQYLTDHSRQRFDGNGPVSRVRLESSRTGYFRCNENLFQAFVRPVVPLPPASASVGVVHDVWVKNRKTSFLLVADKKNGLLTSMSCARKDPDSRGPRREL